MYGHIQPEMQGEQSYDYMSDDVNFAAVAREIESRTFTFSTGPPARRSGTEEPDSMLPSAPSQPSTFASAAGTPMAPAPTIPAKRPAPIDEDHAKPKAQWDSTSKSGALPSGSVTGSVGSQSSKKSAASQGISDFIKKLYAMLEEQAYKHIVGWGSRGDSFVVKDMNEFSKTVLPQHFKHSNFASFVRQLNKYDFHKVKNPETKEASDPQSTTGSKEFVPDTLWEFKHPNFTLAQKGNADAIKRKAPLGKKPDTPSGATTTAASTSYFPNPQDGENVGLLTKQINALAHNQRQIETHLNKFTAEYQALLADVLGQHRAIAAQDAFTATTLQYVINLESRLLAITNPADSPRFPPSQEAQQLIATYSDLSRARYDKMTETSRRAEALGVVLSTAIQNGLDGESSGRGAMRPNSVPQTVLGPTPLRHAAILPDLHIHEASESPTAVSADRSSPDIGFSFAHTESAVYQMPVHSQAATFETGRLQSGFLNPGAESVLPSRASRIARQQPYRATSASQDSPSTVNASPESFDGSGMPPTPAHPSFANLGELNLASTSSRLQMRNGGQSAITMPEAEDASYFPIPGSGPLLPSAAITPGAVTISQLGARPKALAAIGGAMGSSSRTMPSSEASGVIAPVLPQDPVFSKIVEAAAQPVDGENIAAFAAALKGGQSSTAVRSALTSQPLLVRRATYIPGWSQAPRVLLVEDDLVCRNLTTKFLQLFGCTIDIAADGVEAVNKMQSGVYDICMMDISLPNMDGVSATSLIRQFDAMTPIISMTGSSRPDEVLTYFSHGMNDCLPKPFTKEGMLSMLEKHLLHLKQLHANPDMVPDTQALDRFDPENYDPTFNPFHSFGLSNEDYQNIMSGTMPGIRSPSAVATPPVIGTVRGQQLANGHDGSADQQAVKSGSGRYIASSNDNAVMSGNKRARFNNILA